MLWLAPAGLRGGLKLEAYHQSRQPQSLFLCGPRFSGTSDRCSGRCGVILLRAVAAAVSSSMSLRRLRLGVAPQASGTSLSDVSAFPDVAASRIPQVPFMMVHRWLPLGTGDRFPSCSTTPSTNVPDDTATVEAPQIQQPGR